MSPYESPHVRTALRFLIGPLVACVLATTALAAVSPWGGAAAPAAASVAASVAASEAVSVAGTRTLHVATGGSDNAPGATTSPLRTIGEAIDRSASGDTIVVHEGTYHEGITIPDGKRLTIVGQGTVWLDGSRAVTRWRRDARGFVADGWTASFDSSPTYTWGAPDNTEDSWSFVNPARPMAAHPDQVWVGGRAQRQVGSLAALRPGTFYVDDSADRLHLGTDPRGKDVRGSDIAKAISIRSAGTRLRNLNVRRFAPSVPHMGAVTAERSGIMLEQMIIRDNATTGLHVMGRDTVLKRLQLVRNGMLGMSATYADNLRVLGSGARHNNTEGFNHSPVAGGIKIGRSREVLVRNGAFANNAGTGLWFDESVHGITIVGTMVRDNDNHGISLELSADATVVDTVIARNADNGVKINNTSDVALWNNTLVGNGRSINIVQDDRDPTDPDTPGRDPRRNGPDPTVPWVVGPVRVHNNILASPNSAANCLLCVEDFSGRFTAERLRVKASGNVYQRVASNRPEWAVVWSRGSRNPAVFHTVGAFRRATDQENQHLELVGTPAVDGTFLPTQHVRKHHRIAELLPRALVRIARLPSRQRHLGAWLS